MKKSQLTLISLSLLTLIACSSPSKNESTQTTTFSDQAPPADLSDEATPPTATKSDEPKQVLPTPQTESQGLADAVKSGNDESISRAAIRVLAKNSNDVKALNALGFYHYRKGHYSAAILMFNKALKIDPNSSEIHNNLGLTFLAQKEQRDAIKEFRKAIELNSADGNAAANLGSIYVQQKDYTKALVAMEIAYRKNSKDQKVLNNYGIALAANGKFDDAKGIYQQAMKLNENNKDVMLNYAILLIDDLKQNQEGLDLLNKLKFLGPSPEARNRINVLENKAKAGVK